MFSLLYRDTEESVFGDFPKISDHFTKISEDFPKIVSKVRRTFPNILRKSPKISEDVRGRLEDVSTRDFQGKRVNPPYRPFN